MSKTHAPKPKSRPFFATFAMLFTALSLVLMPSLVRAASADKDDHADKGDKPEKGEKGDKGDKGDKGEKGDKADKKEDGDKAAKEDGEHADIRKYTVGIVVNELSKFDLATGTFNAEFMLLVHCPAEPCKPELDVVNGKVIGKPDVLHSDKHFKIMKVKAELTADVDLSNYPFDSHGLAISLEDRDDPNHTVLSIDHDVTAIKDDIKLAGWDITGWDADVEAIEVGDKETKISQLNFAIDVKRPLLMATFKSVVPVLIMMFVAAFTLLLKPKTAQARLNAATGGLMSIVMFQVGQVSSLPPLGYLTRFDKFMVATYLIYLANIAISVAMVRFDEQKNERAGEKAYLLATGLIPGLALVMWTAVLTGLLG